jgi:hypothetical protein
MPVPGNGSPPSKGVFEHVEQKAKAVKEAVTALLLVIVLLMVAFNGRSFYGKFSQFLLDAQIKEASIGGIRFEAAAKVVREGVEEKLAAALPESGPPSDVKVAKEQRPLTLLLEQLNNVSPPTDAPVQVARAEECPTAWVFLGTGTESFPLFRGKEPPKPGSQMEANTDIFKRDAPPVDIGRGRWKLGKIVGVLKEGEKARVEDVRKLTGDGGPLLWAAICNDKAAVRGAAP